MTDNAEAPLTRLAPSSRRRLQILGLVLLALGMLLTVGAFVPVFLAMADAAGDGGAPQAFGGVVRGFAGAVILSVLGFVCLAVGGVLAYLGFMRPLSEITATETGAALAHTGQRVAYGVGTGLARSGVIRGLAGTVRVRCRSCGALDTEDARFCSSCGATI